jgi:hypothetical protein
MKELKDMSADELMEVIRIKDSVIRELREELKLYQELVDELNKKTPPVRCLTGMDGDGNA